MNNKECSTPPAEFVHTSQIGELTGYPSIDKPWLRYYDEGQYDIIVPDCSIYQNLIDNIAPFHDETALEYLGEKISYHKFIENIDKTAKALRAIGVQQGEIVSVSLPNMPEAVYLFYAINKIGAVSNWLDLRCAEKWLKTAVVEAESKVLICLDSVIEKFNSFLADTKVKTAISVSPVESLPILKQAAAKMAHKELKVKHDSSFITWSSFIKGGLTYNENINITYVPNTDAVIAYTGGTTGEPKGVIGTNENINAQYRSQLAYKHNCSKLDRILAIAPPWTYYGLCNSLNNYLCIGACVILIPKLGADELGSIIRNTKPNFIITVPSALNAFMSDDKMEGFDLSFIKCMIVGADKLEESLEIKVNQFLHDHGCKYPVSKGYGMTEIMAAAACSRADGVIGSVGIPTPGVTISSFIEKNGIISECKIGEQGEIAINSPCIMKSYFGSAEPETKDVIKTHSDGTVWAHTGDIGYIGEDGRVYIVGRLKRMFVRNGYKVFPASIEKYICTHPSVSQAAVVSVPDKIHGNITKAVIVLDQSSPETEKVESELRKMLAEELYDYELPDIYEFANHLPLTPIGKIDYRALEKMFEEK